MIYSDFEVQTRDVEIFVFFSFILDPPVSWKCFIFLRDKILFNWKVFLPFEVYKIKQTVKFAMSFVIALNENKWCNPMNPFLFAHCYYMTCFDTILKKYLMRFFPRIFVIVATPTSSCVAVRTQTVYPLSVYLWMKRSLNREFENEIVHNCIEL